MDLKVMLRIYFMQQWHGLSDPAMEDSLYDLKNCGLVCSRERHDTGKVLELVRANQAEHAVATMCRVLGGVHHVSLD